MYRIALTPTTNPALSSLTRATKSVSVPNNSLPAVLRSALGYMFNVLTGENLNEKNEAGNAIYLVAKEGVFHRAYPPKVYRKDDHLAIKWGDLDIVLLFGKKGLLFPNNEQEGADYSAAFTSADISGYGNEVCLVISAYDDRCKEMNPDLQDGVYLELPIGFEEDCGITAATVNSLSLVRNQQSWLSKVRDISQASTGAIGTLGDLEPNKPYKVTNVTGRVSTKNPSWGMMWTITVELENGKSMNVRGNSTVGTVMNGFPKPIVTPQKPATLVVGAGKTNKNGKKSYPLQLIPAAYEEVEGDWEDTLDTSFLYA